MAKVSLRIYNREIEHFIEQGKTNEAIAHCRHILKIFPKHLETYRMLGKAYLEARRYSEATEVFGRVLMAVPDDFVAHVGLSIICDEEKRLDDAIWHMERAFESQSSNAAIQSELQRLYGRRDGIEPPKVRMTRGALARIYVLGELYPQAIAEINSVLAEDPQRVDMQVLLAHAYFRSGQRSDATDICNQLLKRYSYCFDANRIMVELIPASAAAETTQVYRMRISELDPYSNFVKGSIFETDEVSDASVNLERLEYAENEAETGEGWNQASLGYGASNLLGGGNAGSEQPDWLRSGMNETAQTAAAPDSESQSGEGIPDFLRDAGWGNATEPETPSSIFDEEPASDIVQGDVPDWLKAQAPSESAEITSEVAPAIETPDYLNNLDSSFDPFSDTSVGETPDWLKPEDSTPAAAEPMAVEDTPDWLAGLSGAASASNLPDWLQGDTSDADSGETPQAEVPSMETDTPDWLAGLSGTPQTESADFAADIPDWLQSSEAKQESPAPNLENLGSSAQEQDDAVAWLESLAAKHGAKPEELVTDPSKRSEKPPEWVTQAQNIGSEPQAQTPAPNVENLGASAQEQDDAVAWLESLAAKHGAKPEELVTDPSKRSEKPPEWVTQAQNIGSQPPAESEPKKESSDTAATVGEEFFSEFEKSSSAQPAMDETGMWLKSLDTEKEQPVPSSETPDWMKLEEEDTPLERGSIPEWLSDSEPAKPEKHSGALDTASLPGWLGGLDKTEAKEEPARSSEEMLVQNQDLTDWLSGLDDEPGLDIDPEALRAPLPPYTTQTPANNAAQDLPEWMQTAATEDAEEDAWQPPAATQDEEPAPAAPTPAPVSLSADLPDWLQGADADDGDDNAAEDDTPPWVRREQWEAEKSPEAAQMPKPTSPSDWHPVTAGEQKTQRESAQQRLAQTPPSPEPVERKSAPVEKKSPAKSKPARKAEPQGAGALLNLAKSELERGDIPEALMHYGKLIKKGKYLEEAISSLSDSIYRYPVEVGIWQALGDAYMRANRLKEALEAYNKAEELIR